MEKKPCRICGGKGWMPGIVGSATGPARNVSVPCSCRRRPVYRPSGPNLSRLARLRERIAFAWWCWCDRRRQAGKA